MLFFSRLADYLSVPLTGGLTPRSPDLIECPNKAYGHLYLTIKRASIKNIHCKLCLLIIVLRRQQMCGTILSLRRGHWDPLLSSCHCARDVVFFFAVRDGCYVSIPESVEGGREGAD